MAQFLSVRMDGAWFLALAREFGVETAWKMDVEAWKQFSYVFGQRIKQDFIPDPKWPDSFLEATDIFLSVHRLPISAMYQRFWHQLNFRDIRILSVKIAKLC
jgi:hypothetical protein